MNKNCPGIVMINRRKKCRVRIIITGNTRIEEVREQIR